MEATKGTITHAENLVAEKVAASLRHALRGINTDDHTIIDVLTKHSSVQRQEISEKYTNIYGRNLIDDIKAVLGGHFEDVCVALLKPVDEVLVDHLYEACKKKDKYCVFHVLCCHDSEELESLKALFIIKYNTEPETYICESFTGDIRRLLEMIVARSDKEVNEDLAEIEGQQLYDAGVGRNWGTDKQIFLSILGSRNTQQLLTTLRAYERISGHPLIAAIQSEFSGELKEALVSIVLCTINQPLFFAVQLFKCMKGAGTDDPTLIRILITRSEIDLENIKAVYEQKYHKELSEAIKDDTSGDYQKILLKILDP